MPDSADDSPDDFLTIEEASGVVPLSPSSLYTAAKRKLIPHYRVSGSGRAGKIVFRRSDLLAWLESQRVEAEGEPAPKPKPAAPPERVGGFTVLDED